jgi:triacylglycerol lipase
VNRKAIAIAASLMLLTGCSATSTSAPTSQASQAESRAVVIVSGGGAVSPFTTPDQACSSEKGFLSAGNSDTALRDYLLSKGKQVYTAPAMAPWGVVAEPDPTSFGPFKDCPITLPESMTIMSAGDIDAAGESFARFLNYLHSEYGVTDIDLVGHSNGGLYSRAAIRVLKATNAPIKIRSLTMLGTPNDGSVPGSYTWGEFTKADCLGNSFCETFNTKWVAYAAQADLGLNREDTLKYLDGTPGWNAAQGGNLDGIPVTLLAGTYFTATGGNPKIWPYDGITSRYSAWAEGVSDDVIPHRTCWEAPLTHSIFVSESYNQIENPPQPIDWQTALTWNSDALARVNQAIDEADTALDQPNRQGC